MANTQPLKILLLGPRLVRNLGGPSLLPTTIHVLKRYFPSAQFIFISPTKDDLQLGNVFGVNIIPISKMWAILFPAFVKAIFGISLGSQYVRQAVNAYSSSDLIVQMWGIWFADQLGGNKLFSRANQSVYFWVAKIFKKPMVKYTADLGPFTFRWNRYFAKLCLQHFTDLILARNKITYNRLKELGITTPILVCPDTAFLLLPEMTSFSKKIRMEKEDHGLIGISVSHQGARQSGNRKKYIEDMASLADYIASKYAWKILLIPNEVSDDKDYDDVYYVQNVFERMRYQDQAILVSGEYSGPELKGIIGVCDVVVASRYHTIIASLSQQIPVLVLGWHEKYQGVLELVGQEKYLFSVDKYEMKDLQNRFDKLWESREQIREEIREALPRIMGEIYLGGEAVSKLLHK